MIQSSLRSFLHNVDNPLPEEMELIRTKEDAILEHAEIIGYKMLIQLSQRANAQDAIPILKQNPVAEARTTVGNNCGI